MTRQLAVCTSRAYGAALGPQSLARQAQQLVGARGVCWTPSQLPRPQRRRQQRPVALAAAAAAPLAGLHAHGLDPSSFTMPEDVLAKAVTEAFQDTFWGSLAAPRALESFKRVQAGEDLLKEWPGLGLQEANSWLEGLSAVPFPDPYSGAYKWLEALEAHTPAILEEFLRVTADPELAQKGNNIWVPAVRGDAAGYGDDWRTLVLQDRGHWDEDNAKLFPTTAKILQDLNAPTLEVFFARQPPRTGIKRHTDCVNFVQTTHLGLIVPEGDCWMEVGEHRRNWEVGKVMVCETSFHHETFNNTDAERIVLIMRHWHPEVKPVERIAIQFLFDCLDVRTAGGIAAAKRKAEAALGAVGGAAALATGGSKQKKKAKAAKKGSGASSSKGFGAPKK